MPGGGGSQADDARAFREAVRVVLGELGPSDRAGQGLPFLPELPGRGATASMTGRSLAVLEGLDVDLQPAGWRLTGTSGTPGLDHRRTRSLLAQDLDTLEELADGYEGAFKIQVAGPWTLAATVEKPRGEKVLSDHGARRELAESLAEGLADHVADVRRRLPNLDRLVVQVDEPALAAVLGGAVPNASGFHRLRSVDRSEASALLGQVLDVVSGAGAEPWVHACAAGTPWALVRGAGARGLVVDLGVLGAADHDVLAEAFEAEETVVLGVVPGTDPGVLPTEAGVVARVERWLDMLGLDPASGHLGLAPACGLAGASAHDAREALTLLRASASRLS
ncbi:methionine synthase [Nocardioides sp. CBS4Y-1]|uniref:Methionine synthase n=2 Tax=Nocardioides acrostichi TaxID=2784339 RepID=A0A930Y5X6_9ACTN|nr:methionine synthase [Nocardioides acrostichi]